jgi:hypothetical protein
MKSQFAFDRATANEGQKAEDRRQKAENSGGAWSDFIPENSRVPTLAVGIPTSEASSGPLTIHH